MVKGLKLKVRKLLGLIVTFIEVKGGIGFKVFQKSYSPYSGYSVQRWIAAPEVAYKSKTEWKRSRLVKLNQKIYPVILFIQGSTMDQQTMKLLY